MDIKLIACDMDGTLLNSRKELPKDFSEIVRKLKNRGIRFAVASGRQYAALRRDVGDAAGEILYICENGALVMDGDERLFLDAMEASGLQQVLNLAVSLEDIYPIVCRADVAMMPRTENAEFLFNAALYYAGRQLVDDLSMCVQYQDVCKVAFYDHVDAQSRALPILKQLEQYGLSVILSGKDWVDVMKPGTNKGRAMAALQKHLEILPEQCMAFGDYLNDMELLQSVGESYAMANAHPALKQIARYEAPGNDEDGVMRVIRSRFFEG